MRLPVFVLAYSALVRISTARGAEPEDLLRAAGQRAHDAEQAEKDRDWPRAFAAYEKNVAEAKAAVHAAEQRGTPDSVAYYVLGAEEIDYARVLRQMQSGHMFSADYNDHLSSAVQSLRQAAALTKDKKSIWAAEVFLAVARLLQGDLNGAAADLRIARKLNAKDQPAADAANLLREISPGMKQAAATLASMPDAVALPQRQALIDFGISVSEKIVPRGTPATAAALNLRR